MASPVFRGSRKISKLLAFAVKSRIAGAIKEACISMHILPIVSQRGVSGQVVQPVLLASLKLNMAVYGQKLDG